MIKHMNGAIAPSLFAILMAGQAAFGDTAGTTPRVIIGDAVSPTLSAASGTDQIRAYVTGYSFWDNTPPGSAAIAKPVVHRRAGGQGTFSDPITLAVGHSITGGRQVMDFPAGMMFYLPQLRKYAIVEDVCGDGHQPQNGPCHTGYRGHPWVDIYVGGAKASRAASRNCAGRITGLQTLVLNPPPGLAVEVGELTAAGCRVF